MKLLLAVALGAAGLLAELLLETLVHALGGVELLPSPAPRVAHHAPPADAGAPRALRLTPRVSALRCALCHDDLGADPVPCGGCATALHADCALELRRCPIAGCERSGPPTQAG